MRMKTTMGTVLRATAVCMAAASFACGRVESGTVSSGGSSTKESFAQEFCDLFRPCCQQAGLRTDGEQCKALVDLAAARGPYDSAVGGACLEFLRSRSGEPEYCATMGGVGPCEDVFGGSTGTKAPGEPCEADDECAPSDEGEVECRFYGLAGGTSRSCTVVVDGVAGSSPCAGTRRGNVTFLSPSEPEPRVYVCDLADGVYCHHASKACRPLAGPGEPCDGVHGCSSSAYCDVTTDRCVRRAPVGGDCLPDSWACEESAGCDPGTGKCVPRGPAGAACTSDEVCASDSCFDHKCEPGLRSVLVVQLCGRP